MPGRQTICRMALNPLARIAELMESADTAMGSEDFTTALKHLRHARVLFAAVPAEARSRSSSQRFDPTHIDATINYLERLISRNAATSDGPLRSYPIEYRNPTS